MSEKLKIVLISDTHNKLDQIDIPDGDILIHAGDATGLGKQEEIEYFNQCLGELTHKHIIYVPGNHDFLFERENALARSLITNAIVLEDEEINLYGYKFYGSPWTPWFHAWARNLPRGEPLKEKWDLIPQDTDVLITHGPPHMIRDMVHRPYTLAIENVGCEELAIAVKKIKPKIHVFGHIHEGYGTFKTDDTFFVNAACLNGSYLPVNKPIVTYLPIKK